MSRDSPRREAVAFVAGRDEPPEGVLSLLTVIGVRLVLGGAGVV